MECSSGYSVGRPSLRPDAYDLAGRKGRIGQDYLDRATSLTRLRFAQSGVRLAVELNRAL